MGRPFVFTPPRSLEGPLAALADTQRRGGGTVSPRDVGNDRSAFDDGFAERPASTPFRGLQPRFDSPLRHKPVLAEEQHEPAS